MMVKDGLDLPQVEVFTEEGKKVSVSPYFEIDLDETENEDWPIHKGYLKPKKQKINSGLFLLPSFEVSP